MRRGTCDTCARESYCPKMLGPYNKSCTDYTPIKDEGPRYVSDATKASIMADIEKKHRSRLGLPPEEKEVVQASVEALHHDPLMGKAISEYESSIAKIIFLCIKNLDFGLGVNKLAQILTGKQTRFITDFELNHNPAFALLKQYSQNDIKKIIAVLEMRDYLEYEEVRRNVSILGLTDKARACLEGKEPLEASFIDAITEVDFIELDMHQNELYEILRKLRYRLASSQDMPAYVVCYDKPLRAMAQNQPSTDDELLDIKGIGPGFVENYGKEFLTAIRDFVQNRD